jgi:hypothetical protein
MALSFSNFTANAMLNALKTDIDGGPGTRCLKIYSGAVPASADVALTSQTVLATLPKTTTFANNALDKTLEVVSFDGQTASATGTATFFRIFSTGSDLPHIQGTVTVTGGTGDLVISKTQITQGEPVSILSMKFTLP